MRCLIFGASGLLGSQLANQCDERRLPWLGTTYSRPMPFHVAVDLRDGSAIHELLNDYQPDITYLTTPTDLSALPGLLSTIRRQGSRLVSFSPEQVFGDSRTARREADRLTGESALGQAKIQEEALIQQELPEQHVIIRTGWQFGPGGSTGEVLTQWQEQWQRGETVSVASDRMGQPTYTPDLARLALDLASSDFTGTMHLVGPDRHSEFSLARLAAHLLGYDMDLVEGRPAVELDGDDSRPLNPWLDRLQMRQRFGSRAIRNTADGFRHMRQQLHSTTPQLQRAA